LKAYYQEIAPDYARLRHVHPEVFRQLIATGAIHMGSRVLEIGCGTGNYIGALRESVGCHCWGVDPSEQMLAQALRRSTPVQFSLARAEKLDFPVETFDLLFSVDVVHHITDRAQAFREAWRVLRSGGRFCIVTDSEDILRNRQPLSVYFPETIAVELSRYPAIALLKTELLGAGFGDLVQTQVEFSATVTELEPYRARVFSSLRLIPQDAFDRGMARLESDFQKGPIPWISRYVLLWGNRHAESRA